jgi:hypothetical protein
MKQVDAELESTSIAVALSEGGPHALPVQCAKSHRAELHVAK